MIHLQSINFASQFEMRNNASNIQKSIGMDDSTIVMFLLFEFYSVIWFNFIIIF